MERLYLAADATEVTQAVPMGEDNTVMLRVSYIASSATTTDVTVTLEGSDDLENWESVIAYQETHYNVPAAEYMPSSTPMDPILFDFVRVKLAQNGTYNVLLDAGITTRMLP